MKSKTALIALLGVSGFVVAACSSGATGGGAASATSKVVNASIGSTEFGHNLGCTVPTDTGTPMQDNPGVIAYSCAGRAGTTAATSFYFFTSHGAQVVYANQEATGSHQYGSFTVVEGLDWVVEGENGTALIVQAVNMGGTQL